MQETTSTAGTKRPFEALWNSHYRDSHKFYGDDAKMSRFVSELSLIAQKGEEVADLDFPTNMVQRYGAKLFSPEDMSSAHGSHSEGKPGAASYTVKAYSLSLKRPSGPCSNTCEFQEMRRTSVCRFSGVECYKAAALGLPTFFDHFADYAYPDKSTRV